MQENREVDYTIVTEFLKGNQDQAFRLLIKTYQERLYHCIRRMVKDHDDTDDVLQNTFIKAYKGLSKFRGESKLYSWLYRIASNEAYTFLEKKKKRQTIPIDQNSDHVTGDLGGPDSLTIQKKLTEALGTLPEKQRLVFDLKYYQELKYDEISKLTGTSVGALKSSYHIAVKKIETYLKQDQTFFE